MPQALQPHAVPGAPLEDVVRFALEEAARHGATQAEADASTGQGLGVSVRLGEVETIE